MKYNKLLSISILVLTLFLSSNLAYSIEEVNLNENNSNYTAGITFSNDVHSDFTLDDCIKIAINNNLTIQSSKLNEDVYKAKIGQHWANYFPEIN